MRRVGGGVVVEVFQTDASDVHDGRDGRVRQSRAVDGDGDVRDGPSEVHAANLSAEAPVSVRFVRADDSLLESADEERPVGDELRAVRARGELVDDGRVTVGEETRGEANAFGRDDVSAAATKAALASAKDVADGGG